MRPRSFAAAAGWLVLVGCLSALALFGFQIFELKLATGDTLPEYSTYRADPKGLKALYDSLKGTSGINANRRVFQSKLVPSGENKVMILAGVSPDSSSVSEEDRDLFDHWLESGGRLVIALRPEKISAEGSEQQRPANQTPKEQTFPIRWRDLLHRWGASICPIDSESSESFRSALFKKSNRWLGRNCFGLLTSDWQTVAVVDGKGVIVVRAVGPGSLVLMTDSYPLSNESLATDRQTGLLLWLLDHRHTVLFDETHLGVTERPDIMTLVRRYGLEGAIACTIAALLLFVWRCQYSLIPKARTRPNELSVTGLSSEQTFLNLLQLSIPEKELLRACAETWLKNASPSQAQLALVQEIQSGADQPGSVLERYNRLAALLHEKL